MRRDVDMYICMYLRTWKCRTERETDTGRKREKGREIERERGRGNRILLNMQIANGDHDLKNSSTLSLYDPHRESF